jgi:peptidoglycan/LPS O-acetylase OafA/YrhL
MSSRLLSAGAQSRGAQYGPDAPSRRQRPGPQRPGRQRPGRHRVKRQQAGGPAGRDRLYEIDLLRITAALAVVFYHYTFSGYAGHRISIAFPALSAVTRYGYLGVDMFFTISGFVVLLSAWGRRPHEFVISRIVRLYPAYWVAVTITAIVAITLSHGMFRVTPGQYVANLTMFNSLPNIANVDVVYWTLWAEIRFYLIVFVLTWIGITRARVVVLLWVWLAATAVMEAHVLPAGPASKIDLIVQSQWSHYFIAGMALCLIYRTGLSWQLGAILVITYGNAVYQAINFARAVSDRYHQTLHPPVIVAVITVIFVVATLIALRVTRRWGRPWFAVAGTLTYPLYLVHADNGFVLFNLAGGVLNRWVLLVAMVAGMGCAAYAIHRLVEVRLAPRLKRALLRLAGAADRRLPGAWRRAARVQAVRAAGSDARPSVHSGTPASARPAGDPGLTTADAKRAEPPPAAAQRLASHRIQ